MKMRELSRAKREAFTLVELLVVMGIIVILASLTLAAVMRILYKRPEVAATNDMHQMDGAIQAFMTKYNVDFVPSQLKVCQNANSYTQSTLDQESLAYIVKTIGKNSPTFYSPLTGQGTWQVNGISWVQGMPTGSYEILEGHQVIVFLLGGIVTNNGTQMNCVGFSNDAGHPDTITPPGSTRIGPFFDFDPNRLSIPPGKTYFPAYQDSFGPRPTDGKPRYYTFFSSYKHQNGYNRYRTDGSLASSTSTAPVMSDCNSLGAVNAGTVVPWPYASSGPSPNVYVNPQTWQILCCGLDGIYGSGTNLTSATPYYWNAGTAAQIPHGGGDDQANFAFGKLRFGE